MIVHVEWFHGNYRLIQLVYKNARRVDFFIIILWRQEDVLVTSY